MMNLNLHQILESLAQFVNYRPQAEIQQLFEALAPYVNHMANTGLGTDACLRYGCLPLPVNYYSPVPDLEDLKQRNVWERPSKLAGINWDIDKQAAFLTELGQQFGHECNWPAASTGSPDQFYTENGCFCFGCAAGTHCILRHYKPRRVIEIGSGNSSRVIDAALALNEKDSAAPGACEYIIIDPYPSPVVKNGLPRVTQLIEQRVELLDPDFFLQLKENDVLFIDSGHTVRIGGDVNYLILDVLPSLAPGVVIHFHDIPMPYDYSSVYFTNPGFRVFWTESYLLQAFLSCNNQFEILFSMNSLMRERKDDFIAAFPHYDPGKHLTNSGSFWIRRKEGGNRKGRA